MAGLRHSFTRSFTAALLAAAMSLFARASAAEPQINSKSAILIEYQTGRILYEKNSREPLPPASVTKIMTLILVLEAVRDGKIALDDVVTASSAAASMGGTQIWLEAGEQMPVRDLLYAVAVGSANDAAFALAEYVAGSEPAFVEMMNRKAAELGMTSSRFANPSGLPPNAVGKSGPHVMSAYDIAVMSRHALGLPLFRELVSTRGPVTMRPDTIQRPVLWNYNRLMNTYAGMDGIKTGMTAEAGYCLSATAERDGVRLIAVTLGARTAAERDADITRLLNYGFSRLTAVEIAKEGQSVAEVEVSKAKDPLLSLVAAGPLAVAVERDGASTPETELIYTRELVAPLEEGATVGYLVARLDGVEVGRVPVVASRAVEKASVLQMIGRYFLRLVGSQSKAG